MWAGSIPFIQVEYYVVFLDLNHDHDLKDTPSGGAGGTTLSTVFHERRSLEVPGVLRTGRGYAF